MSLSGRGGEGRGRPCHAQFVKKKSCKKTAVYLERSKSSSATYFCSASTYFCNGLLLPKILFPGRRRQSWVYEMRSVNLVGVRPEDLSFDSCLSFFSFSFFICRRPQRLFPWPARRPPPASAVQSWRRPRSCVGRGTSSRGRACCSWCGNGGRRIGTDKASHLKRKKTLV